MITHADALRLLSIGPSRCLDDRRIDHVFGDEPHLELVTADDVSA
jgi:hypothetical protein